VLVAGALLGLGFGLFIAWPVVVCIQTAAYRQLFGPTDQMGFSSKTLPPSLPLGLASDRA
jgi:hypothetical protein